MGTMAGGLNGPPTPDEAPKGVPFTGLWAVLGGPTEVRELDCASARCIVQSAI